jgi:hypothetical protein
MSLDLLPRSAWNARPARHPAGRLTPEIVRGLAFHWPGTTSTRPISRAAVPRALRSWQDYHIDGHGWSDIAYQVAVDQWGRIWQLRGLENRSAANGNTDLNGTFGAVLLILVAGEIPSPAMVAATRRVVAEHRRLFTRSRQLVGHGEIRPGGTSCPGPAVRAALKADTFNPQGNEDDMTPEELMHFKIKAAGDRYASVVLAQTWARTARLEAAITALATTMGPTVKDAVEKALADAVIDVDVNVNHRDES